MTLRSLTIAAFTIRRDGWFNLKIAGQPPGEHYINHLRMGVLKEMPELRDILNRAIDTITPRQREYLSKVNIAARSLLSLINDILDLSKIEAGRLDMEHAPFTLTDTLNSVASMIDYKAAKKGLKLEYYIHPDTPLRLQGDSLRLGQVLLNLANNAVKFTNQGKVTISIEPVEEQDMPDHSSMTRLRFSVRDTGIGMSEDQVSLLFKPFTQADVSTTRKFGGTGLGLAISSQLVEIMGSRINVRSQPGKGSTFSFTLTMEKARDESIFSHEIPLSIPDDILDKRVLIVDDSQSSRQSLTAMLEFLGLKSESTDSAWKAFTILSEACVNEEPFDLVLMDWRMPDMDGIEAARRIKADPGLSTIPAILIITANGREEVIKKTEEMHLEGILIKPVSESILRETVVSTLLARSASTLEARELAEAAYALEIALHDRQAEKFDQLIMALGMVLGPALKAALSLSSEAEKPASAPSSPKAGKMPENSVIPTAGFAELHHHLQTGSLKARTAFAAVEPELLAHGLNENVAAMKAALESLDFDSASLMLEQIMAELKK